MGMEDFSGDINILERGGFDDGEENRLIPGKWVQY